MGCNFCGQYDTSVLSRSAKDRADVDTRLCRNCGLIYISPRMTRAEYDKYYRYYYREDRERLKRQTEAGLEKNFEEARRFGKALAGRVSDFMKSGLTIDVGSSTGGVLFGMREIIPQLEPRGVEPSQAESLFANQKGIPTETVLFENFKGLDIEPSNILCVQSLNHLLDPRAFFEWAYQALTHDGSLVLAVKNFRQQVYRAGSVQSAVQIDHPYMFTPEVLAHFVQSCGFTIVYFDIDEEKSLEELSKQRNEGMSIQHIRFVAKKDESKRVSAEQISSRKIAERMIRQFSLTHLALVRFKAYCLRLCKRF